MTDPRSDRAPLGVGPAVEAKDQAAIDGGVHAASTASAAALDRSLVRGIAWLGGIKWTVQLVTWAVTIIVARILAPEDYGLLSMGAVLLALITAISDSGIGVTVVTVRGITDEQIAQLNGGAVMLGFLCFAAGGLAAIPVARFYDAPALPPVIVAMSFTFVVAAFRIVPGAVLQRELRFPRLAIIDGAQGLLQALATLVLATLGFRYWSLVLAALIGTLVGTAATVAARPLRLSRPRWQELRPILPFTRHVFVSRVLWYAYQNSDFIVAGRRLGRDALGAYSYAWTLAAMPVDKISALVGGVTPSIFAAVQDDRVALRRYFLTITEGLAAVAFPFTIGIALVAHDLVPVVFGPQWQVMTVPLQVLAAYGAVRIIMPPAANALVVTGDTRFQMYQTVVAAIVLPAAFYVGSHWGTVGIALAWVCAHPIVMYLPTHTRLFRRLDLSVGVYLRAFWPAVSGCLLMTAAVVLAGSALPPTTSTAIRLVIEVVAGALTYSATLLLLHRGRLATFLALWRRSAA